MKDVHLLHSPCRPTQKPVVYDHRVLRRHHFLFSGVRWTSRGINLLACGLAAATGVLGNCRAALPETLVSPGSNLAQLVASSPPGTDFILLPGKHYAANIIPKDHQRFDGQPGAILSGAVRLGPFSRAGQYWSASGPLPLPLSHGSCDHRLGATADACLFREDLFVDETPFQRVQAIDQLRGQTWYQFRATGEVLLPFDPGGHLVEMSNGTAAFSGPAHDITIRHLLIEQYASIAQHGAIEGTSGSHWTVVDNEVRYNSGTGIRTGNNMQVESNLVTSNGQLGIGGGGDSLLIARNEIVGNNTHAFNVSWEAGGTKFWSTNHLLFVHNCVRDNMGHGIWTDTDNRNASIVGNWAINNWGLGIFHEISGRVIIADNVSAWNGSRETSPESQQILITGSIDGLVWHNRVEVAPDRGQGIFIGQEGRVNETKAIHKMPEYVSQDNLIIGNEITFLGDAGFSGFYNSKGDASSMLAVNRFEDNEIVAPETNPRRFKVGGSTLDLAAAQGRGQEIGSHVRAEKGNEFSPPSCPAGIGRGQ